ncbi:hypothetical protein D1814_05945 [Alteromonas sp. BL110]|nr:hypothetical protein D1814_05945 [Alteromonas sp. BL110]RKM80990.1 hypothetical protein D7031_19290 [Alteromonas sp. BL110]
MYSDPIVIFYHTDIAILFVGITQTPLFKGGNDFTRLNSPNEGFYQYASIIYFIKNRLPVSVKRLRVVISYK